MSPLADPDPASWRPPPAASAAAYAHAAGAGYEPACTAAATAAATPSCTAAPSRAPSYCAPDCASAPGCWRDPPKRDVFSHQLVEGLRRQGKATVPNSLLKVKTCPICATQ